MAAWPWGMKGFGIRLASSQGQFWSPDPLKGEISARPVPQLWEAAGTPLISSPISSGGLKQGQRVKTCFSLCLKGAYVGAQPGVHTKSSLSGAWGGTTSRGSHHAQLNPDRCRLALSS